MKVRFLALVLFIVFVTLSACDGANRGSGNVITEERQVSGYDSVALTGTGTVEIIQSDSESVIIEAEDNIMPLITTEVQNGTLILSQEENTRMDPTKPIKYTVNIIDINGLSGSGSGGFNAATLETDTLDLDFSGSSGLNVTTLDADTLTVDIAGSGLISVSGQVNDQEIDVSGSGEYQATNLASSIAEISISGSGKATVTVEDTLDVTISGSGVVGYYGDPIVTSDVTGSGRVERLEDE